MAAQRGNGGGRPTIRNVAALAGVSVATVSRVFAGSAGVSAELTRRVHAAADELGYRPHVVAQSLASGRSNIVGMLVPNLANPHFYTLIKQVLHDAGRDGYQVLVADSDESPAAERDLGLSLLERADGLVLCAPRSAPGVLRELVGRGRPVLVMDRKLDDPVVSTVVMDAHGAMRELVQHLVDLGHEHVTYLHGPARSWQEQERWRALRGYRRRGLRVSEVPAGATVEAGHRVAGQVLETGCTAVVAHNDLSAIGLMAALDERGLRIPDDMSVTGYDDIPFGRFMSPSLTTVHTSQEEAASAAWQAMRGLLEGGRPGARTVVASEPVFRRSTAGPRSAESG
ncbi:LacI family transcriptional regulator [Actinomadura darangshiensis]|uniref:LacI family transcriptional regulator n=1 Tax=Actinomadura darangshiensis TaxID=705336 RepID=A0A4R5B9L0_9ACTN|nr:LacI family DNA-binding transcriptional regulator [Actinomadura darangshiensis]TDD83048.1 LacI family transcriptional regulator [Actinomadura darangshiensis]